MVVSAMEKIEWMGKEGLGWQFYLGASEGLTEEVIFGQRPERN